MRLLIKAVIFDYYGVMCPRIAPILARETAKQFKVSYSKMTPKMDKLLDLMDDRSINFYEYWDKLKKIFKNKNAKLSEHSKIWRDVSLGLNLNPKMIDLVIKLRKLGYKVPVLTNVANKMADYNKIKGRYKIFKPVFLSYKIGLKKPSPKIFLHAVKKLKLKPDECIFIDDKKNYLAGARAVGIKTILFENSTQLKKELKRFGINGV